MSGATSPTTEVRSVCATVVPQSTSTAAQEFRKSWWNFIGPPSKVNAPQGYHRIRENQFDPEPGGWLEVACRAGAAPARRLTPSPEAPLPSYYVEAEKSGFLPLPESARSA